VAHALLDACTRAVLQLLAAAPAAVAVPAVLQLQLPSLLEQHRACRLLLQQALAGAGEVLQQSSYGKNGDVCMARSVRAEAALPHAQLMILCSSTSGFLEPLACLIDNSVLQS
jgi:hypothetical protein